MAKPDTEEARVWWRLYDRHASNISDIIDRVYPQSDRSALMQQAVARARELYDGDAMVLLLNTVWVDAPDNKVIHTWPGWGAMCDLCSESEDVAGRSARDEAIRSATDHVFENIKQREGDDK